jgi:hypothetical protein
VKVLVIHHLEPCWGSGYSRFGTTFDELQEKFLDFLSENEFDRVILTRFEDWTAEPAHGYFPELLERISQVHDYGYGWERECMKENPDRFCEGGSHSEVVEIADWMIPLKKASQVHIAGAFDGECIEDLEIALRHLEIDFNRIEKLII